MSKRDFRIYIEGRSKRAFDAEKSAEIIRGWIEVYLKETETTIKTITAMLGKLSTGDSEKWERERLGMLLSRWGQIRELCEMAMEAVGRVSELHCFEANGK
jgi:hypothetical protein